jgi:hypothetical protein
LPGSVVRDARYSSPAEFHVVDRDETRTAVLELMRASYTSDLIAIGFGNVDVRAIRPHPRPPSLDDRGPRVLIGVDGELPARVPTEETIRVVVPRKGKQHISVGTCEVRLPVRGAEEVERNDDVLVRSRPGGRKLDVARSECARQLENPQRMSEVTIGSLHDLHAFPFDREPVRLTVGLTERSACRQRVTRAFDDVAADRPVP